MTPLRSSFYSVLIGLVMLSHATVSAQSTGVSPLSLSFTYQIGGPNPPAQNLQVYSATPTSFSVTVSGAPWLTISPTSGITPSTLIATVTPPAGAQPGTLNGTVTIGPPASTSAAMLVVPVTLQILPGASGNLIVAPAGLTFDYQDSAPLPSPHSISVTSTGAAAVFTASASTSSGGAWLSVTPNSGVTPATLSVYVSPLSGMPAGIYTGTVVVVPSNAGATQSITVTLRVSSSGSLVASPSALGFNYSPHASLPVPQSLSVVNSQGGSTTANISTTTANSQIPWLVVSPGTANTPLNIIVSVNPTALSPGVYYGNVVITPVPAGPPTLVPVTLNVLNYSQLIVNPSSLSFDYQGGGPSPSPQYVSVTSTSNPISFNATISGVSWVTLSAAQGTTPTVLTVGVNPPPTISPGTYVATITLVPTSGGGTASVVNATINVAPANYLSVGRSSLTFNYAAGDHVPAAEIVAVTSSGPPIHIEAVASTAGFSPWLTVTHSATFTPSHLYVSVSPQGLAVGTYTGTISVISEEANNSPQTINVTLNITSQPNFTATPAGLVFSYQIGGSAPPLQTMVISAQGPPASFTVSTQSISGGNWLLAVGGSATPATVGAAINITNLAPGIFTANLLVTPAGTTGATLQIPVILNVSAAPVFQPSTNLVSFQYQTSGATPPSQKVTINATGSSSLLFYTSTVTTDGAPWLIVTPNATVSPADLTISANPQGLAAGFYNGIISVNDAGGVTPTSYVPVSLQVSSDPILTVPYQPVSLSAMVGAGPNAPQMVTVNGTGNALNFEVNTNGASWLQVSPTSGTTNATLSVSGDPSGLSAGYYLGVVSVDIPGVSNSQQYIPVVFVLSTP